MTGSQRSVVLSIHDVGHGIGVDRLAPFRETVKIRTSLPIPTADLLTLFVFDSPTLRLQAFSLQHRFPPFLLVPVLRARVKMRILYTRHLGSLAWSWLVALAFVGARLTDKGKIWGTRPLQALLFSPPAEKGDQGANDDYQDGKRNQEP